MNAAINATNQVQDWYESFRSHFVTMGKSLGYCQEDINDLISQLFLELLEKNVSPQTIINPKAWLTTVFRRKLIDHYRRSGSGRFVNADHITEAVTEPSVQQMLEEVQADNELISKIRMAYMKLPNRCRKVIYLKYYKGLSTEEIAEKTGLSKRSVYNNLFEGVKLLRIELNQHFPGVHLSTLLSCLALSGVSGFFY